MDADDKRRVLSGAALGDRADRRHVHRQVDGRVLAAFAQFDNDVRSDRTRAGMNAALELGRWVFLAPIGGKVWVSYNSPQYLQKRHGLPAELFSTISVVETLAAKSAA
jgi:DNA invertase Pin-like site-specific DNA recombinase